MMVLWLPLTEHKVIASSTPLDSLFLGLAEELDLGQLHKGTPLTHGIFGLILYRKRYPHPYLSSGPMITESTLALSFLSSQSIYI